MRGGPQDLLGELVDRLDDHLLVVVGRQVEVVRAAGLQPGRRLAEALDPLELARGGARGGERVLDAVAQAAVERVAQVVLVQELLADDRGEQRQPDIDRGALVLLEADSTLLARLLGGKGVRHVGFLTRAQMCRFTATDSRVRYPN